MPTIQTLLARKGLRMAQLGRLLRTQRHALGLSLEEIGGDEFSRQTLSNYEREKSGPREETLPLLAQRYQLALERVTAAYHADVSQLRGPTGPIAAKPYTTS